MFLLLSVLKLKTFLFTSCPNDMAISPACTQAAKRPSSLYPKQLSRQIIFVLTVCIENMEILQKKDIIKHLKYVGSNMPGK